MLKSVRTSLEKHHCVHISDLALTAAVDLSVRYINDRFLPDKAIDLVDEAAAHIRVSRGSLVTAEDIADIVSMWTGIPVTNLNSDESRRLRDMETILHRRVIGQSEAVSAVARAIRRGRVGLSDPNRPIGSFLFLGPTGVGKTELCRALAEAVYGEADAMIRLDMSEYMEKHAVSKLIGSPPGYVCDEAGGPVHTIYLSPCGHTFRQADAIRLSKLDNLVLVCGHYEGIDQRFIDECVDEEISLGDFVLTGGEIAAMAVTDAVCRMVPGVLADPLNLMWIIPTQESNVNELFMVICYDD